MGQKVSTSHSSSEVSLSKKDSKAKKFRNWSREKINVDVQPNLTNTSADTEKFNNNDDGDEDDAEDDNTRKNTIEDTLDTNSLAYPSIAELSNFTALSMMRNFEDVSLRNQINETNEKLMDDERCFNTINYEDMTTTTIQFVENTTTTCLRRDSSTCTNEIKELTREDSDSLEDVDDVEDKLSCKDSDESLREKSETLEAKLERVERERDEAMLKLKQVEVRCEAYEEESKCLEASMESMEEKLRTIVCELRSEVAKSKDLERQLSSSFQSSSDITPCEKLVVSQVPAALHS